MTTIRELKARLELEDSNFSAGMKVVNAAMSKFDKELGAVVSGIFSFKGALYSLSDAVKDLDFIAKLAAHIDLLSDSFSNMPGPSALKNRFDAIVSGLDEIDKRSNAIKDLENLTAVLNSMAGMRRIGMNIDVDQLLESIDKVFDNYHWMASVYVDEQILIKSVREAIKDAGSDVPLHIRLDEKALSAEISTSVQQWNKVMADKFRLSLVVNRTTLEDSINALIKERGPNTPGDNWFTKINILPNQDNFIGNINKLLGTSDKWGTPIKLIVDIDFIKKQLATMYGSASGQTTTSGASLTYNQGASGQPQAGSDPFSRMVSLLEKIQENTKKTDEQLANRLGK